MEAASNPTSIAAETDWARNAPRSQSFLSAKKIDAPMPPRTKIANTQRNAPRAGSMAGWMMKWPYTDTAANRTSAITCNGRRSFAARA